MWGSLRLSVDTALTRVRCTSLLHIAFHTLRMHEFFAVWGRTSAHASFAYTPRVQFKRKIDGKQSRGKTIEVCQARETPSTGSVTRPRCVSQLPRRAWAQRTISGLTRRPQGVHKGTFEERSQPQRVSLRTTTLVCSYLYVHAHILTLNLYC